MYRYTVNGKKHDPVPAGFRAYSRYPVPMARKKHSGSGFADEIATTMIMVIKKLPWMRIHS